MLVCGPHLPIFGSPPDHVHTGIETSKVYLKYDGQFLEHFGTNSTHCLSIVRTQLLRVLLNVNLIHAFSVIIPRT